MSAGKTIGEKVRFRTQPLQKFARRLFQMGCSFVALSYFRTILSPDVCDEIARHSPFRLMSALDD